MIARNVFRLLVVVFVFFVTMTFVTEQILPWQKAQLISQTIIQSYLPVTAEWSGALIYLMLLSGFVFVLVAIIGLLLFWSAARWLFLFGYGVLILINWLTQSPVMLSYLANLFTHLSSITGGFIICCVFFTNVRHYFISERKIWSKR
ncbi:hypothetical protein [Motilimonas eburnea]|uniref:hypothetical protein n=1 Tax=Motilimonas eburnea TaxID=1737488 RepID=UPI001E2ED10D|nr:hypothetical protein [Motilimonas eburnea]MCE2573404.1 hypothetical protein [Motilimonas eburnea]